MNTKAYPQYIGPKHLAPKWLGKKGVSRKTIALHLAEHRAQYPELWKMEGCDHDTTVTVRGKWGPHRAKTMCVECGKWIKWVGR